MQIDTSNTVQVSSNVHADGHMSLDSEGMAHLIQVLTNLYADKYLAVLREYSTNARDSHVQDGNPDPIQVTLPTALNPTLVITDHGTGLSRAELLGIYSTYGASSKRNTNTQVGSFGLGSKSAFTITGQFIVTARQNGIQVSAAFAMDAHGVGTVSILAEHPTTESNGVTVSIPVSEPRKMQEAAERFFQAWRPGTVLVDSEQPDSFYSSPDALWLGDDILYTRKGGITVVMGAVAYPLPTSAVYTVRARTSANWSTYDGPGLVVFVPIGSVDITPSREGIRDTERSIAAISAVLANLPTRLRAQLAAIPATDPLQRVFASRKLLHAAENLNVKVSSALPARILLPAKAVTVYSLSSRGALRAESYDAIHAESVHLLTVLVGVPERRSAKRHAKAWVESNGRRQTLIQFSDGTATSGQLDWFRYGNGSPVKTVHFDDIELPPAERSSAGGSKTIEYTTTAGILTPGEILADGRPIAYAGAYVRGDHPALAGHLVVHLSSRQLTDVFLRRVPTAVSADKLVREHTEAQVKALGDTTELAKGYYLSQVIARITYALDGRESEITHDAYLRATTTTTDYSNLTAEQQILARRNTEVSKEDATADLYATLPLLRLAAENYRRLDAATIDHLITYVNAQSS